MGREVIDPSEVVIPAKGMKVRSRSGGMVCFCLSVFFKSLETNNWLAYAFRRVCVPRSTLWMRRSGNTTSGHTFCLTSRRGMSARRSQVTTPASWSYFQSPSEARTVLLLFSLRSAAQIFLTHAHAQSEGYRALGAWTWTRLVFYCSRMTGSSRTILCRPNDSKPKFTTRHANILLTISKSATGSMAPPGGGWRANPLTADACWWQAGRADATRRRAQGRTGLRP